jgi:hypothetical protein
MKSTFLIIIAIILISTNGNCQWYNRVYGVNELNQLSTEQLNNALKWTQRKIQTGEIISGIGAVGIIGGIIEIKATSNLPGSFAAVWGMIAIILSVPAEITGLTIWGVNAKRKGEIKMCLQTAKIGLDFNNDPTMTMFENSNFNLRPAIAVVISF